MSGNQSRPILEDESMPGSTVVNRAGLVSPQGRW